tara:strand:+ start:2115 stop:2453 length:339 start_codon:yes stop_codon:yes gene_type:complete
MKITKKQLKQIIKEELSRAINEDDFNAYWDSVDNRYDGVLTTRFGAEKEAYRDKYNQGWRFVSNDLGAHGWYSAMDRQAYGFEEEDPHYDPDEPQRRDVGDRGDIYRGSTGD